jgi:hypothetical protein
VAAAGDALAASPPRPPARAAPAHSVGARAGAPPRLAPPAPALGPRPPTPHSTPPALKLRFTPYYTHHHPATDRESRAPSLHAGPFLSFFVPPAPPPFRAPAFDLRRAAADARERARAVAHLPALVAARRAPAVGPARAREPPAAGLARAAGRGRARAAPAAACNDRAVVRPGKEE